MGQAYEFRTGVGQCTCGRTKPRAPEERKTDAAWRAHWAKRLGVGSIVTETPDTYQRAREAAPVEVTPDLNPAYQPHGEPANGYAIALALRQLAAEDAAAAPAATPARSTRWQYRNGVPDGYATALAAKEEPR